MTTTIKIRLWILAIIITTSIAMFAFPKEETTVEAPMVFYSNSLQRSEDKPQRTQIEEMLRREADDHGIDSDYAVALCTCESQLDPMVDNAGSTASGVCQFLDGTWEWGCEGDVYNFKDNIQCFVKWFPVYPNWWQECIDKI